MATDRDAYLLGGMEREPWVQAGEDGLAVGALPVVEPAEELGDLDLETDRHLMGAKRLIERGVWFSLPFLLYALFIFVADPFDFVNSRSPIDAQIKAVTAVQLNPAFWKMNQYDRRPARNILLGDSRMLRLSTEAIEAVAGEEYFNFAYGGGTLREAMDTFWFAAKRAKLRKVYLGINLDTYNETNYTERTRLFPSVQENPALYFVNKTVLRAAVYDVYSQLTGTALKLGRPAMTRDAFWQYHLKNMLSPYLEKYAYPRNYRRELVDVAEYCARNGIHLIFVIFPSSLDAQRLIQKYELDDEGEQMRRDLAAMAAVYDFDYENEITVNKENFNDPVHFTDEVASQLIREVWGGQVEYARTVQLE